MDDLDIILNKLLEGHKILIRQEDALLIVAKLGSIEHEHLKTRTIYLKDRRKKKDRRKRYINWERRFTMAKVHFVKKARKDNPVAKRGESYY